MDESYLTGEPYMMSKTPGATVLSGAINGESSPARVNIPCGFLGEGRYQGELILDGKYAVSFREMQFEASGTHALTVSMRPYGGAVARFVPKP